MGSTSTYDYIKNTHFPWYVRSAKKSSKSYVHQKCGRTERIRDTFRKEECCYPRQARASSHRSRAASVWNAKRTKSKSRTSTARNAHTRKASARCAVWKSSTQNFIANQMFEYHQSFHEVFLIFQLLVVHHLFLRRFQLIEWLRTEHVLSPRLLLARLQDLLLV